MIGTDRGVTDSMVEGYGGGERLCVSVFLSECVREDMATYGNIYHLPPLFLALRKINNN